LSVLSSGVFVSKLFFQKAQGKKGIEKTKKTFKCVKTFFERRKGREYGRRLEKSARPR
jgi:hypothetical protein